MKRCALVLFAAFALAACNEGPTQAGSDRSSPLFEIKDAVHSNGNPHFFWLAPMVPNPVTSGTFDDTQSPVVQICDRANCGPTLITFTTTSGPGMETVRVNSLDENYIVNWHTNEFAVIPGPTYRIFTSVACTVLGFADVQLGATGKEAKNLATGDIIGLKDGRTLPIKFRIEPRTFVDNGDGTITDTFCQLMWEKKTNDGGVHDVGKIYSWSTANGGPFNGEARDFLDELNTHPCFAGYCNWRLPSLGLGPSNKPAGGEFPTILDCSFGVPCIDPIFGPTSTGRYWSASSDGGFCCALTLSFTLNRFTGFLNTSLRHPVRAVRTLP